MDICFEGVGQVAATFQVKGENAKAGMAVALTGNGTVEPGSDGAAVCGVLLGSVRGGAAAVQIGGVAKVGYFGTAPEVGWQELACDGTGGVKAADGDDGTRFLVLAVDEDADEDENENEGRKSVVIKL